jgi:hypothetical protein
MSSSISSAGVGTHGGSRAAAAMEGQQVSPAHAVTTIAAALCLPRLALSSNVDASSSGISAAPSCELSANSATTRSAERGPVESLVAPVRARKPSIDWQL